MKAKQAKRTIRKSADTKAMDAIKKKGRAEKEG